MNDTKSSSYFSMKLHGTPCRKTKGRNRAPLWNHNNSYTLSFHVVPPNITNVNNKLSRSKLKQPASTNLVECQHQTMKFRSSICKLHLYVEIQIRSYKTKGVYKYSGTRAASKFTYPVSGQTKIASTWS